MERLNLGIEEESEGEYWLYTVNDDNVYSVANIVFYDALHIQYTVVFVFASRECWSHSFIACGSIAQGLDDYWGIDSTED